MTRWRRRVVICVQCSVRLGHPCQCSGTHVTRILPSGLLPSPSNLTINCFHPADKECNDLYWVCSSRKRVEKGSECPIPSGVGKGHIRRQTQSIIMMAYFASARAQHPERLAISAKAQLQDHPAQPASLISAVEDPHGDPWWSPLWLAAEKIQSPA